MTDNAIQEEALRLKSALEKVTGDNYDQDRTNDILTALSKLKMTEQVLRATKLGVIINKLSKSLNADTSTIKLATDLVGEWKNAMRPAAPVATSSAVSSATFNTAKPSQIPTAIDVKSSNDTNVASTLPSPATPVTPFVLPSELMNKLNDYAEGRRKMIIKFSEYMSMNTTDIPYAFNVGCDIERSVHTLNSYDFPDTRKAYSEKCRTLILNLKRNEDLRYDILDGKINGKILCELSVEELATTAEREATQLARDRKFEAARSDFWDNHREKVQKANGLDAGAEGEFTCKKCKQSKTSYTALQTRSSDEPMTLFVRCLTCGNRWRTE